MQSLVSSGLGILKQPKKVASQITALGFSPAVGRLMTRIMRRVGKCLSFFVPPDRWSGIGTVYLRYFPGILTISWGVEFWIPKTASLSDRNVPDANEWIEIWKKVAKYYHETHKDDPAPDFYHFPTDEFVILGFSFQTSYMIALAEEGRERRRKQTTTCQLSSAEVGNCSNG